MMGIIKSYARATISSNLRDDEHHHDHEKLAAVALAGLADGGWPHANLLFRIKYAHDASVYATLSREWRELVKSKAQARKWPIEISPTKVARLSLEYWINSACPECHGRGHLPHDGIENVLSDDACPICNGSGTKPVDLRPSKLLRNPDALSCSWFPFVRPSIIVEYVEQMVELADVLVARAGGDAMRKLAGEMDF